MASSHEKSIYMLLSYVFLFLLLQQCELVVVASRVVVKFHPPPIVETINRHPYKPSSSNIFSFNRYKKYEIVKDYSGPGHSPGMGHQNPPGVS